MNLDEVDPSWLTALSGIRFQNRWHSTLEPTSGFEDRKAQIWLRWMDNSFRAQSGRWAPPVWLYNRFKWGPHSWPVRWRDLPHMRVTDCGLTNGGGRSQPRCNCCFTLPLKAPVGGPDFGAVPGLEPTGARPDSRTTKGAGCSAQTANCVFGTR